ncbi:MAG: hypothetical protein LBU70_09725 [Chitinispirillales bacterium]|jgi:hypothetical protein|nr:hypothetical protein [Chitinispirillales bacterium]
MVTPDQSAVDHDFEDGLRQILTPGPAPDSDGTAAVKPRARGSVAQKMLMAADKKQASEQKMLLYFKIVRAVSVVAFIVLLAWFVQRIITYSG